MFKNVLIAEDHESASISLRNTLEELGIAKPRYVYYCDDAMAWIKNNLPDGEPYDLLITDLSFDEDHRKQVLKDGKALIKAVRLVQPGIKILVFSAESRADVIDKLFNDLHINGYVRKARADAQELKRAIESINNNKQHYPAYLRQVIKKKNTHNFTELDVIIISLLSQGMLQKDIPAYLKQNQITPSSLSSLEKRLNHIKEALEFSKNEQLVAFCKDMGII